MVDVEKKQSSKKTREQQPWPSFPLQTGRRRIKKLLRRCFVAVLIELTSSSPPPSDIYVSTIGWNPCSINQRKLLLSVSSHGISHSPCLRFFFFRRLRLSIRLQSKKACLMWDQSQEEHKKKRVSYSC